MELYIDRVKNIIDIVENNLFEKKIINKKLLGDKLVTAFENNIENNEEIKQMFLMDEPSENEIRSWKNSIPELLNILSEAGLDNLYVVFEYQIPGANSRIDATIIGEGRDGRTTAMIVELKQWEAIDESYDKDACCVEFDYHNIRYNRSHPCAQLRTYEQYLKEHHTEVEKGNVKLISIAFLHNFTKKEGLFNNEYCIYKKSYYEKTFTSGTQERERFIEFLNSIYINNAKEDMFKDFTNGEFTIGERGFEKIKNFLSGKKAITLLKEQRSVIAEINREINNFCKYNFSDENSRLVGIISGDVGVGKSILGLEIIRQVIERNKNKNGCYFTVINKTLNEILSGYTGDDTATLNTYKCMMFRNVGSILIVDEAHRLGDSNENTLQQNIEKLLKVSKMVFFLQDDGQRISIKENGSYDNIVNALNNIQKSRNYKLINTKKGGHKLKTQMRSAAASNYIETLNSFLKDDIDFKSMYREIDYFIKVESDLNDIHEKLLELNGENYCKWIAPYCWGWTKEKNDVNEYENDIVIGDFKKAWNPNQEFRKKLQYEWYIGKDPKFLNQVGCVYTTQGLEFDYTGVIFWDDLYWENGKWKIDLNKLFDNKLITEIVKFYGGKKVYKKNYGWEVTKDNNIKCNLDDFLVEKNVDMNEIIQIIKNTYRIILSRAKKGTYIWFKHEETKKRFEEFFSNYI